MIDEAIGKILGMAMAYGVSSLGLFLAYVNYRKRTLGAEKVMTPRAWAVVATIVLAVAAGVLVVARLAEPPESPAAVETEVAVEPAPAPPAAAPTGAPTATVPAERKRWPLVGIMLPAVIFLVATWITVALYRHFSRPAS